MYSAFRHSLGLNASATIPAMSPAPTNSPRCLETANVTKGCTRQTYHYPCSILGNNVKLFYWPPATTPPANISQAVTVVDGSVTFTSPSVYLSFASLSAVAPFVGNAVCSGYEMEGAIQSSTIGSVFTSALITLAPSALSSMEQYLGPGLNTASIVEQIAHGGPDYYNWIYNLVWDGGDRTALPVNYADLTRPPARQYYMAGQKLAGQTVPGCNAFGPHPECSTIFDGAYRAQLSLPAQVLSLEPLWSTCSMAILGIYDPPSLLSPQSTVGVNVGSTTLPTVPTIITVTTTQSPVPSAVPVTLPPSTSTTPTSTTLPSTSTLATVTISEVVSSSVEVSSSIIETTTPTTVVVYTTLTIASTTAHASSETLTEVTSSANALSVLASAEETLSSLLTTTIAVAPTSTSSQVLFTYAQTTAQTASAESPEASPQSVTVVLGSSTLIASQQSGAIILGSATLTAGQSAVTTIAGQTVSAVSSAVIVGSQTISFGTTPVTKTATPAIIFTLSGETVTAVPSGSYVVVGSATLSAGGPATTISNGQVISAASGGIVYGSSTVPLAPAVPTGGSVQATTLTVGGHTYTAALQSGSLVIGSSTLQPGAPGITTNGATISAYSGGVIIGTSTVSYAAQSGQPAPKESVALTEGSQTLTAVAQSGVVVVGSATLSVGGPAATVSGQFVSAASGAVIVGSSTVALSGEGGLSTSHTAGGSNTRSQSATGTSSGGRASSSGDPRSSDASNTAGAPTTSSAASNSALGAGILVYLGLAILVAFFCI